ncbi:restriction endonuclease subunit S [Ferrimicrobium acidiphilum]|jgi:type I restriction enzyme S subunit|uniref:restriction endonuclease subunit S n=1 Tax=Ferrimicrobium acidiphilum TaxID=121039 RepID=UPI0023F1A483
MTAEQFCVSVRDGTHDSPRAVQHGRYLVTSRHIIGGRLDLGNAYLISQEDFDAINKRSKVDRWDVLISMIRTVGEPCLIKEDPEFAIKNIGLFKSRGEVEGKWLYYYLRSPDTQQIIREQSRGTTQQYIPLGALRDFPVVAPTDKNEMRGFVDILGTLDDKIELNRRMNETLEAMARALFQSWFVDFDPVRAKAEGRDTGLPKHVADLFPDSFEDSELGEIPRGWEAGALGDVAEHPRRGVQPKQIEPTTPYIALEHMPRRCIALSEWDVADGLESNKFEFKSGEILFGKLRPYFHKVGVAPVDGVCSTDIVVVSPRTEEWFGFVLGHVSSDAFVEHTNAGSTGTKMPRTSWGDMARYVVAIPPITLAKAFTAQILYAVDHIIVSIHESRTLAPLRDTLLPKLISGELRVNDAERIAAEATA